MSWDSKLRDKRLEDPFKSVRKSLPPKDFEMGKGKEYTRSDRRKAQNEIKEGYTEYLKSRMEE